MNNTNWRAYVGRYFVFAIAFISLLFIINALFIVFSFFAGSNDLRLPFQVDLRKETALPGYDKWVKDFESQTPLARNVTFEINQENVKINLQLSVDGEEPLAKKLLDTQLDPPSAGFLLATFGRIHVDEQAATEMVWNGPNWLLDQKTNQLSMSFDTVVTIDSSPPNSIDIWWAPSRNFLSDLKINDELQITLLDSQLRLSTLVPVVIEKDKVIFRSEERPLGEVLARIEFVTDEPMGLTRQVFINQLGNISVPLLSRLFYALVELLPLVVLVAVGFGYIHSNVRILKALKLLTLWMLSIHFLLYFIMAHVDLYDRYLYGPFQSWATYNFRAYFSGDMWSFWTDRSVNPYDLVVVCLVGVLLPLVFLRDSQPAQARIKPRPKTNLPATEPQVGWRSKLAALIVSFRTTGWKKALIFSLNALTYVGIASVGSYFLYLWAIAKVGIPSWVPLVLVLSVAVFLVRTSISFLAESLWGKRIPTEVSWLATLVILFIVVYPSIFLRHPDWNTYRHWGWFFFNIVFGVLLIYKFSMALIGHGRKMKVPFQDNVRLERVIFVVALALAVPSYYGDGNGIFWSFRDDLVRLAFSLDNLLIYLWAAAILWVLYQDGKPDLSLRTNTRWVGVLAGASLLFNLTNRWFYIPAAFLLGWLALSWLTRKPQWAEQKIQNIDTIFKQVVNKRPEMLKNINLLSIAERTLGALHKKKRVNLSSGDEDFEKARVAINTHIKAIEKMRKAPVEGVDDEFKNMPLAFGPYESAWKNGTYGAGWAFLLAIPWLVVYLIGFMKGTDFPRSHGLNFIVSILSIGSFWTGIGFFMGFFFPYLRGNTGLQKGVWLALAVILPTLPLHIIHYRTPENWQGFLLWAIQVLVECILLGLLAFDYGTVRRAGSNWESLLEIHGLLPLGVGISGVVIALLAAIGNLIADPTQALALWNSALQIVLPVFSQADKFVN